MAEDGAERTCAAPAVGRAIRLQPLARKKVAHLGAAGAAWLTGLPDLVADLERQWSITVGRGLPGGSASWVARARTAAGHDAVVKVAVPGSDVASEVRTLAAAGGRGYVRLLAADVARRAALLEALGPPLGSVGLAPERQLEVLCATLRQAWEVPRDTTAGPADAKARGLAELVGRLWEELDRPCPERVVDRALAAAASRAAAADLERCVVVHGDPHPGNALRVRAPRPGAESGFVLVDPDGFLAEREYDLGVVLRDWCTELLAGDAPTLARRWCRLLATGAGAAEAAVWEWGFLERVSTGLYVLDFGADRLARRFLRTAELLVDA